MATRRKLFDKAERLGVTITVSSTPFGREFEADAPSGRIFDGSDCPYVNLGGALKGEEPDWRFMMDEINLR